MVQFFTTVIDVLDDVYDSKVIASDVNRIVTCVLAGYEINSIARALMIIASRPLELILIYGVVYPPQMTDERIVSLVLLTIWAYIHKLPSIVITVF